MLIDEESLQNDMEPNLKNGRSLWGNIAIVVFIYLGSSLFIGSSLNALMKLLMIEEETALFVANLTSWVVTIGVIISISKTLGISIPSLRFKIDRFNPTVLVIGLVMIIAAGIVLRPLMDVIPSIGMDLLDDLMGGGILVILSVTVIAPIAEEFLFRGVIQKNISLSKGGVPSILISAFIFGLVHIIPQQAVNAMAIGLILGSIYYLTNSLSSVIILHFLNNGLAYMLYTLFGDEQIIENHIFEGEKLFHNPGYIAVYCVSLLLLITGGIYVVRMVKSSKTALNLPVERQSTSPQEQSEDPAGEEDNRL